MRNVSGGSLFLLLSLLGFVGTDPPWSEEGRRQEVYRLVPKVRRGCELGLLLVVSTDLVPSACPFPLRSFGISLITFPNFLHPSLNLTLLQEGRNLTCLLLIPKGGEEEVGALKGLLSKVNLQLRKRTFTVLLLNPLVLPRRRKGDAEEVIVRNLFSGENETGRFRVNSELFFLLGSDPSPGPRGGGGMRLSLLEGYWVKRTFHTRRLLLPQKVLGDGEAPYPDTETKTWRRGDLQGTRLKVSVKVKDDWTKVERRGGTLVLLKGTMTSWLWDLEKMANFSSEIVLENDPTAGTEADLSINIALVVDYRAKAVDFLQPVTSTLVHIFFRQPKQSSIRDIVTAPFHPLLWLSLLSTWILIILLVKSGGRAKGWLGMRRWASDVEFGASIGLWAFAANCQKSWHLTPQSLPLKITFICGSLCGVIAYVGYSAAIVSTLAGSQIPIGEFRDLVNYKYSFTVHNKSVPFQQMLRHLIDLFNLPQRKVLTVETEDEVSHLLDQDREPKAFLSYEDLFYQFALKLGYSPPYICGTLSKVKLSDFQYKSAIFTKKGSEFRKILNHKLLMIRERGFNHRYAEAYEKGNILSCVERPRAEALEPIEFRDAFTAFLVIFVGLLLAAFLLLQELVVKRLFFSSSSNKEMNSD